MPIISSRMKCLIFRSAAVIKHCGAVIPPVFRVRPIKAGAAAAVLCSAPLRRTAAFCSLRGFVCSRPNAAAACWRFLPNVLPGRERLCWCCEFAAAL